jgi:enoyl-CoA hydratase/carnithine racemase
MTEQYRFRATAPLTRDWQHFRYAEDAGVATVTLNRPEKLNPLTFESYADLRDLLTELPHHEDVRVLVIRGEGRAFCGGGDVNEIIGELIRMEPRDLMRFTKMTGDVIRAMRECPVPIVAAVHGIAAGAGAVVALAADFRVVGASGKFAFLFTKVGLSGGDTAVKDLATTLANGPTLALAQTKSLLTRELDMPIGSAMELDAMTQALLMTTRDHAEFHSAFNERRRPRWQGR